LTFLKIEMGKDGGGAMTVTSNLSFRKSIKPLILVARPIGSGGK
jgi:hypothetical protein